jgi:excinuclease ABC subunit A
MPASKIVVKGAHMHNLQNIDVEIPRDKLTVITGLSGSGKSSLAFDTIYAEGQRRYVESLSTYARQFLGVMDKPDVESIEGLSPAISIDQKTAPRNPRSTVGTVTEIYDHLRLLFARVGTPHCPKCAKAIVRQTTGQIIEHVAAMEEGRRIMLLAPLIRGRKGEHLKTFEKIKKDGFVRVRVDGEIYSVLELPELDKNKSHNIEVVIDRLVVKNFEPKFRELSDGTKIEHPNPDRSRLADSVEMCLAHGEGVMMVLDHATGDIHKFSENFSCEDHPEVCIEEIEPRNFSFNSPHGACDECHGLGTKLEIDAELIIPNQKLSIAEGAIMPWASTTSHMTWYNKILAAVAKKNKFSIDTPLKDLTEEQLQKVLYGTGEEKYTVRTGGGYGGAEEDNESNTSSPGSDRKFSGEFQTRFEGVIPNLERRYLETDSDYVRKKIENFMRVLPCPTCEGRRLKPEMLAVTIEGKSIADTTQFSISEARDFFNGLTLTDTHNLIAEPILREIHARLKFLDHVGVAYLTLDRAANTISGGEAQRIRLATQIGSHLVGVLYVLDEPSIGLHQKDNERLIETLAALRDSGNTVIVVEHDVETMLAADYILDIGPGAGKHGGHVVAAGTPKQIMANKKSVTGKYLAGKKEIPMPKKRRKGNGKQLEVLGAAEHNLKEVDAQFPLGTFTCVTGVSGSGKSTLVNHILVKKVSSTINRSKAIAGAHREIRGIEHIDKLINIDQSPIGRTPRSNPATYTGVFTDIRDLFAQTPEARLRGYKPGRFSFNVKGGRCEVCQGDGLKKIEMHFLPAVYVPCETCKGKRYNREALEITYRGKTIADVLDMTVNEASEFFENIPSVKTKLQTLQRVGLGYIHLGQSATTLSGGEAQRIKLSTELSKRSTGKTLYVLDEPTTGLHFDDVNKLIEVLQELVDGGNTVIVIEHNLDLVKCADYVIDMGPDGGYAGGMIVAQGTPEQLAKTGPKQAKSKKRSYTGEWLAKMGI